MIQSSDNLLPTCVSIFKLKRQCIQSQQNRIQSNNVRLCTLLYSSPQYFLHNVGKLGTQILKYDYRTFYIYLYSIGNYAKAQWSVTNGPQNMRDTRFSSSVRKYSRPSFTNSLIESFPSPLVSMTAKETAASSSVNPKQLKNNLNSFNEMKPE